MFQMFGNLDVWVTDNLKSRDASASEKAVFNPNFGCSGTPLLIVDKGEGNLGHLAQTFSLSRCGVVHNFL